MSAEERIVKALAEAEQPDGGHHLLWVIDQMVRALTGCPMVEKDFKTNMGKSDPRADVDGYIHYTATVQGESEEYLAWVAEYENGEDGPDTYSWDEGVAS